MATASPPTPLLRRSYGTPDGALTLLRVILAFSIISTALHYTHNFIEIEHYPAPNVVSNDVIRVAIVVGWPLHTAAGLLGYWLYTRGEYGRAAAGLALSSIAGLVTPLHFTSGSPHVPAFWYATIFTDGIAGFALLAFAYWTAVVKRPTAEVADRGHTP